MQPRLHVRDLAADEILVAESGGERRNALAAHQNVERQRIGIGFSSERGELPGDLVEHMHGPAKACVVQAKAMARQKIFQDKRKTLHEIGAYTTLEILLNAFCGAALDVRGNHGRSCEVGGATISAGDGRRGSGGGSKGHSQWRRRRQRRTGKR